MDHQESPIDLINETAKMKHLSQEDFKSFTENQVNGYNSSIGGDPPSSTISMGGPSGQEPLPESETNYTVNERNLNNRSELCKKCIKKQRVMQKLEAKQEQPGTETDPGSNQKTSQKATANDSSINDLERQKQDSSSLDDINTDILYSRFRFVVVDCRLSTL